MRELASQWLVAAAAPTFNRNGKLFIEAGVKVVPLETAGSDNCV